VRAIRWGFLSTAKINGALLEGARLAEGVDVVAVASRDPARAESYAREFGFPRAHGSYEALLADDDVDAVYISLPNSLHHEWTLRALEAGKHVLCEKPYTRRPREVEEAFGVAERRGLVLSEAFMWRHNRQTARFVELLPEIGELQTIRSTFGFRIRDAENVRLRADLDGGALMDVGCYCVSGARLLAGEPKRVYGEQVVGPTRVDLRFTGTMRFAADVVAEFTACFTHVHRGLEAIGSDGTIFAADPWHSSDGLLVVNGREERVPVENSYTRQLENVGAAIRRDGPLLLGREDALGQARAIEALYASADAGKPIGLPASTRDHAPRVQPSR
jgi:D-xylose 1-dehydrogenase (NADP+, D-xylono-1,5-lactone-forming)